MITATADQRAKVELVSSSTASPIIVWLRQDLRLSDNPALRAAADTRRPVVPVFILDDAAAGRWSIGGASRWWLHGSLAAMDDALAGLGSRLVLREGPSSDVLGELVAETKADVVHVSARFAPWARAQDAAIAQALGAHGVRFEVFPGALLHDPDIVRTGEGHPYKVFTPFWRKLQDTMLPHEPARAPRSLPAPGAWPASASLASLRLTPTKPDWAGGLQRTWTPGEQGARERLKQFLAGPVDDYARTRDFPGIEGTSRLSPHLHFGEISPRACWQAALAAGRRRTSAAAGEASWRRELAWREFSYHLLHHWPDLPETAFRPEFAAYPWCKDDRVLKVWQTGRTGYPIVDAGMRQLWHTGWMHNRVRMIVASFLIKHLLIDWREGEAWFWDTLVDADLANNAASWQWVAGSGADAAPYFRIFNPVTQSQKFDSTGDYVRAWVPELARLEAPHVHAPWRSPADALARAGVMLGETYPHPIVDHDAARRVALQGYEQVKANGAREGRGVTG